VEGTSSFIDSPCNLTAPRTHLVTSQALATYPKSASNGRYMRRKGPDPAVGGRQYVQRNPDLDLLTLELRTPLVGGLKGSLPEIRSRDIRTLSSPWAR
jgi:hypothetical protein